MIRDVAELREHGQVWRRVDELDVDVATWRAGMRRIARREGMRIRTFIVEPAPSDVTAHSGADDGGDVTDGPLVDVAAGPLVYALRTDLPPDLDKTAATMNQRAAARPEPTIPTVLHPPTPVTSLTEHRARRSGHPCIDPHPDHV